jgi:hypothetical protein
LRERNRVSIEYTILQPPGGVSALGQLLAVRSRRSEQCDR